MKPWKKLITDPEFGGLRGTPLFRAAIGIVLAWFELDALMFGTIQLGRKSSGQYLYFSDHHIIFPLLCVAFGLGAVWAFANAWKRYLMHDKAPGAT
jgi:hypothetical protein